MFETLEQLEMIQKELRHVQLNGSNVVKLPDEQARHIGRDEFQSHWGYCTIYVQLIK